MPGGDLIRQEHPAAVVCPKCKAMLHYTEEEPNGRIASLFCNRCGWLLQPPEKSPSTRNTAKMKDRMIVNTELSKIWSDTTLVCPKCQGAIMGRWWPGQANPRELRCSRCEYHLLTCPAQST